MPKVGVAPPFEGASSVSAGFRIYNMTGPRLRIIIVHLRKHVEEMISYLDGRCI